MSDPNVNIFEALRRMGTKIPFRFPMVDTLVPTVQMFDVSRIVSSPIEPRGFITNRFSSLIAGRTHNTEILALGPGGLFVESLTLRSEVTGATGGLFWQIGIHPTRDLSIDQPLQKVEIGGTPTKSLGWSDETVWLATLDPDSVQVPLDVAFVTPARWFVPAGSTLRILGPKEGDGFPGNVEETFIALVWTELPASFEEA